MNEPNTWANEIEKNPRVEVSTYMTEGNKRVFRALKDKPEGVTHQDFPRGFALRSRIAELRNIHQLTIQTKNEKNANNNGHHARYKLTKDN